MYLGGGKGIGGEREGKGRKGRGGRIGPETEGEGPHDPLAWGPPMC